MLYWMFAPEGAVTTMVPVGTVQVGCVVTHAVGAAGVAGGRCIVRFGGAKIQPVFTSLAVNEYLFGARLPKVVFD